MGKNSTPEKLVMGKVPDGHCSDSTFIVSSWILFTWLVVFFIYFYIFVIFVTVLDF